MNRMARPITILVADDDADDRLMIEEAFLERRVRNQVDFVEDGEELLEYLHREGKYTSMRGQPYPGLILLDLNMPKVDGREALRRMKTDALLQRVPVVVLTTSRAEEDIIRTYGMGVNSFITKPVTFEGLVDVVSALCNYWIEVVALPPECECAQDGLGALPAAG